MSPSGRRRLSVGRSQGDQRTRCSPRYIHTPSAPCRRRASVIDSWAMWSCTPGTARPARPSRTRCACRRCTTPSPACRTGGWAAAGCGAPGRGQRRRARRTTPARRRRRARPRPQRNPMSVAGARRASISSRTVCTVAPSGRPAPTGPTAQADRTRTIGPVRRSRPPRRSAEVSAGRRDVVGGLAHHAVMSPPMPRRCLVLNAGGSYHPDKRAAQLWAQREPGSGLRPGGP